MRSPIAHLLRLVVYIDVCSYFRLCCLLLQIELVVRVFVYYNPIHIVSHHKSRIQFVQSEIVAIMMRRNIIDDAIVIVKSQTCAMTYEWC